MAQVSQKNKAKIIRMTSNGSDSRVELGPFVFAGNLFLIRMFQAPLSAKRPNFFKSSRHGQKPNNGQENTERDCNKWMLPPQYKTAPRSMIEQNRHHKKARDAQCRIEKHPQPK
jgi:hypothetical protein